MRAAKTIQGFCYSCAVGFLVAGLQKRASLNLDAADGFIALLLVFTVTLLLVCVGTLSRMAAGQSATQ